MADNTTLNAGTGGDVIATDDIGGVKYQRMKLVHGADGVSAGDVATTNPFPVAEYDTELALIPGITSLRDRMVAMRYSILADSIADGLATFWTSTTASGGTTTVTGGEGLIQTSASATGSAQLVSTTPAYLPGQVSWLNSAMRFGDTGSAGNIRRIGACTVSGSTPQDGFYYELNGTTFNIVVAKAGVLTTTASGSWTMAATAPFTLDLNYHSFEIRWTANTAHFYIDNVLRHTASGGAVPLTATLNFPMLIQSINTSGANNRVIAVRNIGLGRFGTPELRPVPVGGSGVPALPVNINANQCRTYTSACRAVATGTLTAGTAKQIFSFEKTNAAVTVKVRRIIISGVCTTAVAGVLDIQLSRGTAASTGGTAATVNGGPRVTGDTATVCTMKSLPTITAATVVDVIPFAGVPATTALAVNETVLYDWQEGGDTKPWTLVSGSIDSLVLSALSSAAQAWTLSCQIIYTEE